ncbi:aminotransferase class V-fold PLP-dependent enzyme [Halobium salinum]|uniref:Aminotransferase class V-fold PLP-dependent enzyme n=1 Tax=Halobium salinum TaxID=1364940 RepID=A0ABD5PAA1_9EURY|nr:aminotransferase class V-fold PLP-dependent enzyme [Halobium salinum]
MDPAELRADVPTFDETVYLNTGASGPSPRRVVAAANDCLERHEFDAPGEEGMYPFAWDQFDRTRERVAEFVGADPDEIALTQSTSDGINRVACAIDWEPGDTVVRTDLEHSAGILPWKRLRDRRGVEVEVVQTDAGRLDLDDLDDALADAELLFLSAIDWCYGTELPVAEAVELAHEAGARVLVDAVQVPGQTTMDVREWGADYVVAAGHKWLLGPWGAGFVYVDRAAAEALEPSFVGYRSVEEPMAESYVFKPGAPRLEVGTTSPGPYAGLRAAMDAIEAVGLDTVERHVERLTDRLKAGLPDGALLSPREYESGLVSWRVDDAEATVERLREEGVVLRSLPVDGAVRASLHVVNTEEDVDRLLGAL